ncbi:morphogenetic protein [Edwardsiella tarda]|uniref:morphogenetic protein n=1 Tax=Edwardsiella tarda TaxID=636 RepID=UPI0030812A1F|nr:hypothetical protein GBS0709_24800 [Edwardsiella tarda]
MKERPIIFNDEMVRAILDGRKTMTRRPVKGVMPDNGLWLKKPTKTRSGITTHVMDAPKHGLCPFGSIGDRLWVRETWARYNIDSRSHDMAYRATVPNDWPEGGRWRPSIHMPRWASRITLEITDVRVERLHDITEGDARSEGVTLSNPRILSHRDEFRQLWGDIYGCDGWRSNPWVWVIAFRRVDTGCAAGASKGE